MKVGRGGQGPRAPAPSPKPPPPTPYGGRNVGAGLNPPLRSHRKAGNLGFPRTGLRSPLKPETQETQNPPTGLVVISEPLAETFHLQRRRAPSPCRRPSGPQAAHHRRGVLRLPHRRPQRLDGHCPIPALLARHPRQRGAPLSQGPRKRCPRSRPGSRSATATATAS